MFRPVRVTVQADLPLPITVEAVRNALRAETDLDGEIERLIKAAVAHYEGWGGVLGIAIAEQTWRQDFGRFEDKMCLNVRPVADISSVTYRDEQGQTQTIADTSYALLRDGGGQAYVRFVQGFSVPTVSDDDAPVSIEYMTGWPAEEVPADIQTAIILFVQKHLDEAARANWEMLDRVEKDLISKYRTPMI